MNEFIEKNKQLFKIYYTAALIMGWILIVLPGIKSALLLFYILRAGEVRMIMMGTFLELVFGQIILGVFLLAVAQFIRFLISGSNKASGLLQHIDKIIYLYAIVKVARIIFVYLSEAIEVGPFDSLWGSFTSFGIPSIAFVLILVGLGVILKRSIPIIEESKTLV
ncbi:MAG: hypothetical protein ACYSUK_07465 [Planctomycetota bacterium]|jgi:hypothetical protein